VHDDGREVEPWSGVRSFHPEMRLVGDAPLPQVVDALASGLSAAGFRVLERDAQGLRARHTDLLGVLSGSLHRTVLTVRAAAGEPGVVVAVASTGVPAAERAARGLTDAVRRLRARGAQVEVGPWTAPG
jgi:hypothetical protein